VERDEDDARGDARETERRDPAREVEREDGADEREADPVARREGAQLAARFPDREGCEEDRRVEQAVERDDDGRRIRQADEDRRGADREDAACDGDRERVAPQR